MWWISYRGESGHGIDNIGVFEDDGSPRKTHPLLLDPSPAAHPLHIARGFALVGDDLYIANAWRKDTLTDTLFPPAFDNIGEPDPSFSKVKVRVSTASCIPSASAMAMAAPNDPGVKGSTLLILFESFFTLLDDAFHPATMLAGRLLFKLREDLLSRRSQMEFAVHSFPSAIELMNCVRDSMGSLTGCVLDSSRGLI